MCDSPHLTGILSGNDTHHNKYLQMVRILDGELKSPIQEYSIELDDFKALRIRLQRVQEHLTETSRLAINVCKLCTTLQTSIVCHGKNGCPRAYNICYKCCIGNHQSKECKGSLFKVPSGFCWRCWMPLQSIFGFSFHRTEPSEIGTGCTNPAKDLLKQFAIMFFHSRKLVPTAQCVAITQAGFIDWLFTNSAASAAGNANVPGVLTLLEAAFEK